MRKGHLGHQLLQFNPWKNSEYHVPRDAKYKVESTRGIKAEFFSLLP
jgi:hypothetical protein